MTHRIWHFGLKYLVAVFSLSASVACSSSKSSNPASETTADSGAGSGTTTAKPGSLQPTGPNTAYMRFNGRINASAPGGILMAWPGTNFQVRVTSASRVSAMLHANQRGENNVIAAFVDNTLAITAKLQDTNYNMVVPVPSGDHVVTFVKKNEAGNGGILVGTVSTDGQFEKLNQSSSRLIEIVGDNASTGAAADGPPGQTTCTLNLDAVADPNYQNAYHSYGALLAQSFNADYSIIAASQRGVVQNYDASSGGTMAALYPLAIPTDSNSVWKPSQTADVVVVNLGTNDLNYWLSNTAGVRIDQAGFVKAYVALLQNIRTLNPSAYIITSIGPLLTNSQCLGSANPNVKTCTQGNTQPLLTTAQSMIQSALTSFGDAKASFVTFAASGTNISCDYLPDAAGHQAMAAALTTKIASLTGWTAGMAASAQPTAAAAGSGPKTLPGPTSSWNDPLLVNGVVTNDPNVTGISMQQFPECHYCSPQSFNGNTTGCDSIGLVGVSQPCEGYCHVPDGFEETHFNNPPVSGNHYPEPEATLGEHTSAVPRGHLLHSMEHGAIIFAYNCPNGCDSELATLRATIAALNQAPVSDAWVIMTPDPLLTTSKFAIMSWTWLYTTESPDQDTLRCFIDQHKFYGRECLTGHSPSGCPALLDKPMSSTNN